MAVEEELNRRSGVVGGRDSMSWKGYNQRASLAANLFSRPFSQQVYSQIELLTYQKVRLDLDFLFQ